VNAHVARLVWQRAGDRCEYCKLPAKFFPAPFQIDHIVARQHGGKSEPSNLALSCLHCNVRKGPNIAGIDPAAGAVVRLFNPREDTWSEHFKWKGAVIVGRTAIGSATVHVLGMNEPDFLKVRSALMSEGIFGLP
jgi:hypothetical protein